MGYREDVTIDKNALDQEWLQLARKECDWGEAEANAEEELEQLENKLVLKRAELDGLVRADPAAYGISDAKEKAFESAVLRHAEYQALVESIIAARKNSRTMKVARKAMSRHEKALDRLTDLYHDNYWAREIPEKKVTKVMEDMENQRLNEHMNERSNRKLRRRTEGGGEGANNN